MDRDTARAQAAELSDAGVALARAEQLLPAKRKFEEALLLEPDFTPPLMNLAYCLSGKDDLAAAEIALRRLMALAPSQEPRRVLSNVLLRREKYAEAWELAKICCANEPNDRTAWHNLALIHYATGRFDQALKAIERCGSIEQDSSIAVDRAHILMAAGVDLNKALAAYDEVRHAVGLLRPLRDDVPEWRGEDLRGKRLMLCAEQGFGDTIMTARFALAATKHGAAVTLAVPTELVGLLDEQGWPVAVRALDDIEDLELDFRSPFYSAMRWLGIEWGDIQPAPYLRAPERDMPPTDPTLLNIGICWASGRRGDRRDWRRRHPPLAEFARLAEVPGVRLWSLQCDEAADEIDALGWDGLVTDMRPHLRYWADTAAFLPSLNLIVSVDTALVHLAGAMGRQCWMLNQFARCWRWVGATAGVGRPWYESVRIVDQESPGNWAGQIDRVKGQLSRIVQQAARAG